MKILFKYDDLTEREVTLEADLLEAMAIELEYFNPTKNPGLISEEIDSSSVQAKEEYVVEAMITMYRARLQERLRQMELQGYESAIKNVVDGKLDNLESK